MHKIKPCHVVQPRPYSGVEGHEHRIVFVFFFLPNSTEQPSLHGKLREFSRLNSASRVTQTTHNPVTLAQLRVQVRVRGSNVSFNSFFFKYVFYFWFVLTPSQPVRVGGREVSKLHSSISNSTTKRRNAICMGR